MSFADRRSVDEKLLFGADIGFEHKLDGAEKAVGKEGELFRFGNDLGVPFFKLRFRVSALARRVRGLMR